MRSYIYFIISIDGTVSMLACWKFSIQANIKSITNCRNWQNNQRSRKHH